MGGHLGLSKGALELLERDIMCTFVLLGSPLRERKTPRYAIAPITPKIKSTADRQFTLHADSTSRDPWSPLKHRSGISKATHYPSSPTLSLPFPSLKLSQTYKAPASFKRLGSCDFLACRSELPPMCCCLMKTLGTVDWPVISLRAAWMADPSAV